MLDLKRLLPAAAAILVMAACTPTGTDGTEGTASTGMPSSTLAATSTTHPPPPRTAPSFEEVTIGLSADGTHLVDPDGMTLYLFTLDDERTSSCERACAEAWPPLLGDPEAGAGVDQDLLGNAERDNGSIQVTYNGHPLYTYVEDEAVGDAEGHGFNDVWFKVDAGGDPISP